VEVSRSGSEWKWKCKINFLLLQYKTKLGLGFGLGLGIPILVGVVALIGYFYHKNYKPYDTENIRMAKLRSSSFHNFHMSCATSKQ
jgi:hypothetical protein